MSPGWTTAVDVVTYACWGVVGAVWGLGALRARRHGPPAEKAEGNDAASIASVIASIAVLASPHSLWRHLELHAPALLVTGMVVVVLAAAATVWSRLALGDMWSSAAVAKRGHALRTTGPYAITRHPIYTWMLVLLLGTTLTQRLGRWIALLPIVAVMLWLKARTEERLLRDAFPGEYDRYREQVPALIPLPRRRSAIGRTSSGSWHR
jgi:protein-S-isoprenylcysteine O-methyltransferase Ste14